MPCHYQLLLKSTTPVAHADRVHYVAMKRIGILIPSNTKEYLHM